MEPSTSSKADTHSYRYTPARAILVASIVFTLIAFDLIHLVLHFLSNPFSARDELRPVDVVPHNAREIFFQVGAYLPRGSPIRGIRSIGIDILEPIMESLHAAVVFF